MCVLGWACWCRVPLQGVAARCCLKVNGVCALERACSCRPRRHAAAVREVCALWSCMLGAGMLVPMPLQAAWQNGVWALERACWCHCRVLLEGSAVSGLEQPCWWRCRVPLQGAACHRVPVEGGAVTVVCALACGAAARWWRVPLCKVLLQGVAWVLPSKWHVGFGAGMLVLLQGAAARCWCKVMLEGAVRVVCALPSGHAGAAAITFMP